MGERITVLDCEESINRLYRKICNMKIDHAKFTKKFIKTKKQKYAAKALNTITNIEKYNNHMDKWIKLKKELEDDSKSI